MEHLIKVMDLCKIYNPGENEVRALDHVNLEIDRGEFVAIIGQSGSGKSTFMNMLGCLDIPTSGKYYLNGTDVSTMSDNELSLVRNKEIGFIFQGFNLIPNLTAVENVELPLIYRGIDKKERRKLATEALQQTGISKSTYQVSLVIVAIQAVVNMVTGIIGVVNSNKIEKASLCYGCGIVLIVCALINNGYAAFSGAFSIFSVILSLILPLLYFWGALKNRQAMQEEQGTVIK